MTKFKCVQFLIVLAVLMIQGCALTGHKDSGKSDYVNQDDGHSTHHGNGDMKIIEKLTMEQVEKSAAVIVFDKNGQRSVHIPNRALSTEVCTDKKRDGKLPVCSVFSEKLFLDSVVTTKEIRMHGSPVRDAIELWPGIWIEFCYDDQTGRPLNCRDIKK